MNTNGKSYGHNENIRKLLEEGAVINALKTGVQRALRMHKALGNPVAMNENGEVILVPPEHIRLEEPPPPLFSENEFRNKLV